MNIKYKLKQKFDVEHGMLAVPPRSHGALYKHPSFYTTIKYHTIEPFNPWNFRRSTLLK